MASSIPVTVEHPKLGELQVLPRQVPAYEASGWKLKQQRRRRKKKPSSDATSGGESPERPSAGSAAPDPQQED
jgi:hypothetical protein